MKKIGTILYNKLALQADEAQEQGFNKLAERVRATIGNESENTNELYSYSEMKEDIHRDLWKVATNILSFYDLESADIGKIDKAIVIWASKIIDELEHTLDVDNRIKGSREPKLPGEDK